jgi:arylsulfatase A-like enzyme
MHGAHGLFRKGWPHEESVRVPLLVRFAPHEGSAPGSMDSGLVSLLDLPRWTIAWTKGKQPRTPNPGREIEIQRISMPSVVALPHQCDRAWRGVRTRTRKLVLNADGSPWLFFDLKRDPLETTNLADDPARQSEMADLSGQA